MAGAVLLGAAALGLAGAWRRERTARAAAEAERDRAARELDRRLNELFSLRELGYALAASLQLDRLSREVVRYATRFLRARGAMLLLTEPDAHALRIAAAEGTLLAHAGRLLPDADDTVVLRAIGEEHLQVAAATAGEPVRLGGGITVQSAAVVPLRAHGVMMGALVVVDREDGPFTPEDLWLLSTVATQVAVVVANSRFFELIRQGKEAWESTFDALTAGVALLDPAGRVRRANRALGQLVGLGEPAIVGRPLAGFLFDTPGAAGAFLEDAVAGRRADPLVTRSDRLGRLLRLNAAPVPEAAGSGAAVVLVEDVTAQRRLEEQLIQADKMGAVGQLVSGVAHELNNPLASIAGLAELLLEQAPPTDRNREHLRVIHEQAERAGRIVRNLLTFARKGTPEKGPVDLNDIARRTAQLVAYEFRIHDVVFEERLPASAVEVRGDPHELQQVVLNLLTNATWAVSREGGHAGPRRVMLETGADAGEAWLRVSDSGPGVPAEHRTALFTPFFTTKPPGKGTGLGLPISYGIVESHGGRLDYDAAPGGGAQFTIRLPAAGGAGLPRTRVVLVADGDPSTLRTASAVLSAEGARVVTAASAEEALAAVRRERFDLVVADVRLALPSGVRFLAVLGDPALAPRATLGLAGPGESAPSASAALVAPAPFAVLARPFSPRELREAARGLLGG
ncbi:MAG TPA: ATP-binding protein [Gemmatimonadales bacterium]|nr:ATP-binding protein [Gemmatimonadales bacterium]